MAKKRGALLWIDVPGLGSRVSAQPYAEGARMMRVFRAVLLPPCDAFGGRLASALLAYHRDAQRVVQDVSHRVLDGDIRRRHQIARAFGGDVLRADATPSQLQGPLDRANAYHGLATEPFRVRRHRFPQGEGQTA